MHMQTHRFGIGESVAYTELLCPDFKWRREYEIISLLPVIRSEPEYQLRSADPKYDRVASEHELAASRKQSRAARNHRSGATIDASRVEAR
jgi:hypothetical protein